MTDEILPLRYHIEIYPESFVNDPIFFAQSDSPFPVPHIGHRTDTRTFPGGFDHFKTSALKIVDVSHLWWKIDGSHLTYKLMIAVSETAD